MKKQAVQDSPFDRARLSCKAAIQAVMSDAASVDDRLSDAVTQLAQQLTIKTLPEAYHASLEQLQESIEWDLLASSKPEIRQRLSAKLLDLYESLTQAHFQALHAKTHQTQADEAQHTLRAKLVEAIRAQRKVRFVYKGYSRTGDVYMYGLSPKGKEAIALYQTGGRSSSDTLDQFKYFLVDAIRELCLLKKPFTPEDDMYDEYDPDDRFFQEVFEQV